jgi:hypothetical protein
VVIDWDGPETDADGGVTVLPLQRYSWAPDKALTSTTISARKLFKSLFEITESINDEEDI